MRITLPTTTRSFRPCCRLGVPSALLLCLAATPVAQGRSQEPAATMPDPMSQHNSAQPDRGVDRRAALPAGLTSEALSGPPSPGTLYAVVDLSDRQMAGYAVTYRDHMTATWPVRQLLVRAVESLFAAVGQQDQEGVQRYQAAVDRLWREVGQRDSRFDAALQGMLSEDQFKRYREWDRKRRRGAEAEQRLRWLDRQGTSAGDAMRGGLDLDVG
jgi:hypothetical protein